MKKGISKRLFLYIICVVLGISGLILLANSLLLRPLYFYSLKTRMVEAVGSISKIDFSADTDVWTKELNSFSDGQEYDIVIGNGTNVLYSSSVEFGLRPRPDISNGSTAAVQGGGTNSTPQEGSYIPVPQTQTPPAQDTQRIFTTRNLSGLEQIGEGTYFGTVTGRSGIELMVCTKGLSNGISIVLTQPVEPINKSIQQANILLAGCTLLALALSAIFVFKLSKRFTKPIRQIKNTVGSLAALDFSEKCDVKTGDELQSLGDDVNRLADELKGALDTLRLQNEKLEKDIIAQRQFISNASHELRTPLSLIKGYADEINTGFAKKQVQKELYIQIIAEEAAKMNRLLKEMLELTRMESGAAHLQNERLSVGESIQTFLDKYDGFISENSLYITTCLVGDTTGLFDPIRFEQVLANYISNAARYGDEKKQLEISTEIVGDSIRISVFNTGRAVPEDIMDSIWDGFYKADLARTRAADSYGLGLSVVKAIQNAANQQFGVKNVLGGVIFWFDVARFKES